MDLQKENPSWYVLHVMGKLKTSYVLCDLHSPWARAVMLWHLFSVLLKIMIWMSWCQLVQSHGRCYWVNKSPMSRDALQVSLLQTMLPLSGAWGNFVLQKQNSLLFFLLKELQLSWIQSFSSSLLLQGVSSWKLYAGTIYRTRHLPRDWQSKSCEHLPLPFPSVSLCVCRRKRASGMFTTPGCSVWRSLFTWMVTGHFTDYKNLKTQAQEMFRMGARHCLQWCSPGNAKLSSFITFIEILQYAANKCLGIY